MFLTTSTSRSQPNGFTAASVNALRELAGTFAMAMAAKGVSQSQASSSLELAATTQVTPIKEKRL